MSGKISQSIMVWFLPVVMIGGLFFPVLGLIVFLMMISFLILSYFRGRLWCSSFCPRGAFLDMLLSRFSLKKKLPAFLYKPRAKWLIFACFMAVFILQFVFAQKTFAAVGFVFVKTCIITTLIAILLGIPMHYRRWCAICPMGTLQEGIHSLRKAKK